MGYCNYMMLKVKIIFTNIFESQNISIVNVLCIKFTDRINFIHNINYHYVLRVKGD